MLKDAKPFASQDFLMQLAEGKADLDAIPKAADAKPAAQPTKAAAKKARVLEKQDAAD